MSRAARLAAGPLGSSLPISASPVCSPMRTRNGVDVGHGSARRFRWPSITAFIAPSAEGKAA